VLHHKETTMLSHDEHLAHLRSDIAILREQLDHVENKPDPERARQFLRRELFTNQQMYLALLKKRRRQLLVRSVEE
jgi:hypothetical protein